MSKDKQCFRVNGFTPAIQIPSQPLTSIGRKGNILRCYSRKVGCRKIFYMFISVIAFVIDPAEYIERKAEKEEYNRGHNTNQDNQDYHSTQPQLLNCFYYNRHQILCQTAI